MNAFPIITTFILLTLYASAQTHDKEINNHCFRNKSLSFESIKSKFPFSKAFKTKVVSFKPKHDPSNKDRLAFEVPIVGDGQVDTTQLFEQETLSKEMEKELFDLLMNYNFNHKFDHSVALCEFSPRNAIIFYDKVGCVLAYAVICFECNQYETSPGNLQIGDFCKEKFQMMKTFLIKVGVKYGVVNGGG